MPEFPFGWGQTSQHPNRSRHDPRIPEKVLTCLVNWSLVAITDNTWPPRDPNHDDNEDEEDEEDEDRDEEPPVVREPDE
jgi:hypothetical protein